MSDPSDVWTRYRDNTARHLIGIARDLQHRTMHHLIDVRGYRSLRPSLGPLLSLVAAESRPLGNLASELSISPQACSQLVNVAEDAGYVERLEDLADRRARRVGLTGLGRSLVDDAIQIIREVEEGYRRLVGAREYAELTRCLGRLFHGLDIRTHTDARVSATSSESIGVLPLISVRIQQDLMEATSARGHAGLKMSHAQVLPLIGGDGARVHQLARIQGISRQAISATARDLEQLGYLRREADPLDRRGVVLRLTERGTRLLEDSVASLDEVDRSFRRVLGVASQRALEGVARALYQALHLEEEIFEARAHTPSDPRVRQLSSPSRDGRGDADLEGLAVSLTRQLGARGAKRLARLLDARASKPHREMKSAVPSGSSQPSHPSQPAHPARPRPAHRSRGSIGRH